VKKVARFMVLWLCFFTAVSCCFVKVPPINNDKIVNMVNQNVPIDLGAVLFIAGLDMMRNTPISGSAVVVASDVDSSWAISAGHVCYPEPDPHGLNLEDWAMIAIDMHGDIRPMRIAALDMTNDVCVFKIPDPMPFIPLANKHVEMGDRVYLGAFPMGMYEPGFIPLFEGFFSGELTVENKPWSSYTVPVAPGSSGGGVVNEKGELVGIVSMAVHEFENITLAVKLENVQNLLDVAKRNPNRLTILH